MIANAVRWAAPSHSFENPYGMQKAINEKQALKRPLK